MPEPTPQKQEKEVSVATIQPTGENKEEPTTDNQVRETTDSTTYKTTPVKEILPEKSTEATVELPPMLKKAVVSGMPKLSSLELLDAEIEAEEAEEADIETPELTLESAQNAWNGYLETVKQMSTKAIMRPAEVQVKNDKIIVLVGSKLGENTIRQEPNLMDFMRAKLKNNSLELLVEIDPNKVVANTVDRRPKSLTEREKYQMMKEVNPLVEEMRKRFDLKLDRE